MFAQRDPKVIRGVLILLFGGIAFTLWIWLEGTGGWTDLQRYYFPNYIATETSANGNYRFLYVLESGGSRIARSQDVVRDRVARAGNESGFPFALSALARRRGAIRLQWREFPALDSTIARETLRKDVYEGRSPFALIRGPIVLGCLLVLGFVCVTLWRNRERTALVNGKLLRGPRLLKSSEFNLLNQSDGIGFEVIPGNDAGKYSPRRSSDRMMLRIRMNEETSHFMLVGDSGTGKSSLIRQMLSQIRMRGESAIVYDPALEFTPQFYDPKLDVILNPADKRMPLWHPSDEVKYPLDAAALAGSLFPDKPGDKNFFTEAARKIFAHLLRYRPTPQDLTHWMRNIDEIDKRVLGTELEVMIRKTAAAQRAAVQGTFNQAVAGFSLLPSEADADSRWSAANWSQHRKGWVFFPSSPTLRDSVRPLFSMWLDLLLMRLMDPAGQSPPRVWLVLDELSSLQRLPQLPTVMAEGRKSNISIVVGFQGRSQIDSIYGHPAEAMLSQPMTKVFFRTSEPNAAEWVSRSIGEVEILRLEETQTRTFGLLRSFHHGTSRHLRRYTEPLVLPSTIQGLPNLTGYVKSRDLVIPATFCYAEHQEAHSGFEPRSLPELEPLSLITPSVSELSDNKPRRKTAPQKNRRRDQQGTSSQSQIEFK